MPSSTANLVRLAVWNHWVSWEGVSVFERFSGRSRRVLVLAQEEARLLRPFHISWVAG
jgi:hypothetical protein